MRLSVTTRVCGFHRSTRSGESAREDAHQNVKMGNFSEKQSIVDACSGRRFPLAVRGIAKVAPALKNIPPRQAGSPKAVDVTANIYVTLPSSIGLSIRSPAGIGGKSRVAGTRSTRTQPGSVSAGSKCRPEAPMERQERARRPSRSSEGGEKRSGQFLVP